MQFRCVRITTAATTTIFGNSCYVPAFYITCTDAGTAFTLKIQDKAATPRVFSPAFTLTVPTDGQPKVIPTGAGVVPAVLMEGGVDLITGGTPGAVNVWMAYERTRQGG